MGEKLLCGSESSSSASTAVTVVAARDLWDLVVAANWRNEFITIIQYKLILLQQNLIDEL